MNKNIVSKYIPNKVIFKSMVYFAHTVSGDGFYLYE